MESLILQRAHVEEMFAHARGARPEECCGLVGVAGHAARTIYRMRNVASNPLVTYQAAVRDLAEAQVTMRGRREDLLGIYHSHPLDAAPVPSERDVRLAYHPSAIYFIIGFDERDECVLRAFRIFKSEARWETASFQVVEA